MRNKVSLILLLLLLLVVVSGCESRQEQLKDSGLFGEHPLVRIESFGAVQGSVSGSFFLGIGSINSSLGSEFKIQIYWCPKPGEMVATALPYSKFLFIIDEEKKTPSVEFVFDKGWLLWETDNDYSQAQYSNLNDFILSEYMVLAKVRIASATIAKEIYLPIPKKFID